MNVQDYLDRIGFKESPKVDYETLEKLQQCHQMSVPFENLIAMAGKMTNLTAEDLYEKIVIKREGGWCYMLNGIFHWLLTEIGFEVDMMGSATITDDGQWRNSRDHMVLVIHLEGGEKNFLTDVGFGMYKENFNPIEIREGNVSEQPNGRFNITSKDGYWRLYYQKLDCSDKGKWELTYRFKEDKLKLADFQAVHETYTHARDPLTTALTKMPECIMKANGGKDTLLYLGNFFRHYTDIGLVDRRSLVRRDGLSQAEIETLLKEQFGMMIDMSDIWMFRGGDEKQQEAVKGMSKEKDIE